MAVKLRCPDCREMLKLPETPEAGTEVECPKCGTVFEAPGDGVKAAADADDRPKAGGGDDPKPKPKGKKAGKKAATPPGQQAPRRRKAKKKKGNPYVMWAIIIGAVLFVGSFAGALIWFFTKKSASQEMMSYLPDDCDEVVGLNLGHLQKYPEFYKTCEGLFSATGFKQAGGVLAKALGMEFNDAFEYVVQGNGKVGGKPDGQPVEATVFKVKAEFDPAAVGKIPGAQKATANGVDYYRIPDPGLNYGGQGVFVFAPTGRLVVFTRGDTPAAKLKAMLTGNKDNPDATAFVRGGQLSKAVSRGTVWKFTLFGRSVGRPVGAKPAQGAEGGGGAGSEEDQLQQEIVGILSPAQGSGYKASVGSRDVRGEWMVWLKESSAAGEMAKKWKEKEWMKDEEKDPPRWFKSIAQKSGIGKTAVNVIRDGLSFRSSGELFIVRAQAETNLLKNGVGSLVGAFTQVQQGGPGGGGIPAGGITIPPPGGGPGGPGPGRPGGGGALPGPGGGVPIGPGPRRAVVRRIRRRMGSPPRMPV